MQRSRRLLVGLLVLFSWVSSLSCALSTSTSTSTSTSSAFRALSVLRAASQLKSPSSSSSSSSSSLTRPPLEADSIDFGEDAASLARSVFPAAANDVHVGEELTPTQAAQRYLSSPKLGDSTSSSTLNVAVPTVLAFDNEPTGLHRLPAVKFLASTSPPPFSPPSTTAAPAQSDSDDNLFASSSSSSATSSFSKSMLEGLAPPSIREREKMLAVVGKEAAEFVGENEVDEVINTLRFKPSKHFDQSTNDQQKKRRDPRSDPRNDGADEDGDEEDFSSNNPVPRPPSLTSSSSSSARFDGPAISEEIDRESKSSVIGSHNHRSRVSRSMRSPDEADLDSSSAGAGAGAVDSYDEFHHLQQAIEENNQMQMANPAMQQHMAVWEKLQQYFDGVFHPPSSSSSSSSSSASSQSSKPSPSPSPSTAPNSFNASINLELFSKILPFHVSDRNGLVEAYARVDRMYRDQIHPPPLPEFMQVADEFDKLTSPDQQPAESPASSPPSHRVGEKPSIDVGNGMKYYGRSPARRFGSGRDYRFSSSSSSSSSSPAHSNEKELIGLEENAQARVKGDYETKTGFMGARLGDNLESTGWLKNMWAVEDCIGCRMIWHQVESDVSNSLSWHNVQESFEHNCIDAQQVQIFYPVCQDMYLDKRAMIRDYLTNKFTVEQMCCMAGFCCDLIPPPPPPIPPPPPGPDPRKFFKTDVHFFNGYDKWAVGDYAEDASKFKAAFTKVEAELKKQNKDLKQEGVVLVLGGHASYLGTEDKNQILSERRAKAVGCYLSEWLTKKGYPKYEFRIGYFGFSESKVGGNSAQQKQDRRVDIFFPENTEMAATVTHRMQWKHSPNGGDDGGMSTYCKSVKWKSAGFSSSWLS